MMPTVDIKTFGENNFKEFYEKRSYALLKESLGNDALMRQKMGIKRDDEYCEELEKIWKGEIKEGELAEIFRNFCLEEKIDPKNLIDKEERKSLFYKIIDNYLKPKIKAKSFDVAVENQKETGIKFESFESDTDFSELTEFLEKSFSKEILDKALISRISYFPEIVAISLDSSNRYYLPMNKYEEWKNKFPKIVDYKIRAINSSVANKIAICLHANPIEVYSFVDENLENFEYLEGVPENEKMKIYKLGAIAHEVGHNLYGDVLNVDLKTIFKKIMDEVGHLTHYSKKYADGTHGDKINYSEEFAEAIRLKTTAPEYLKNNFPQVFYFLEENLPGIK